MEETKMKTQNLSLVVQLERERKAYMNELNELLINKNNETKGDYNHIVKYTRDDFDDMVEDMPTLEFIERTINGEVNPKDDYFGFDINGNFESATAESYHRQLVMLKNELEG